MVIQTAQAGVPLVLKCKVRRKVAGGSVRSCLNLPSAQQPHATNNPDSRQHIRPVFDEGYDPIYPLEVMHGSLPFRFQRRREISPFLFVCADQESMEESR